jgi:uncharacterized protein
VLARALALALLWAGIAAAEVPVPALSARVTDLTGTLDPGQQAALEARLEAFERAKGSQVVVLIVPTTQPETIAQYAVRVADAWKIGRKSIDDGVLLVVAKQDRAVWINVQYGLEGALPDAVAKRIVEEVIFPRFRAGDYHGGISEGVERIIRTIENEPLPPPSGGGGSIELPPQGALWLIVVVPMLVGGMVRVAHNRFTGATVAGGLAAALAWWLTGAATAVAVAALFCFFFVLSAGAGRGGRGGWASGGWSGGGGLGGGGLSGGGGRGGGGGAGGHW